MSDIDVRQVGHGMFAVSTASGVRHAWAVAVDDDVWVFVDGHVHVVTQGAPRRRRQADHEGALAAPMPATVSVINVTPGQQVTRGDVVIVLEAMKRELPIVAPRDARIARVACHTGELVQPGIPLIELEPEAEPAPGTPNLEP